MNARTVVRVILVFLVLAVGIFLFVAQVRNKPAAKKEKVGDRRTLVEVAEVTVATHPARVEASGVVLPSRQVLVASEVGGRVVSMHPELVPGGRVPKNTQLLKIDARDYRLAVEQQFAQVDRAQTELELERGRKRIAEREWSLLGSGKSPAATGAGSDSGSGSGLALREPQLRSAQAALKAAESGLERARLTVGKTTLSVPFPALVQARNVDVGQLIGPGAPIATLVGTDTFWVQVSVPVGRLSSIDIPGLGGAQKGSPARVKQDTAEGVVERTGRVIRLLGDLDPAGRMARLLIEIDDPLGLAATEGPRVPPPSTGGNPSSSPPGEPRRVPPPSTGGNPSSSPPGEPRRVPLLLGAYVEVLIEGRALESVAEVPRAALHGDTVYLVGPERELIMQQVDVAWRQLDSVLVAGGLKPGDRVVVSPISAAVAGMKLKVLGDPDPADDKKLPAAPQAKDSAPKATTVPPTPSQPAKAVKAASEEG